MVSSVSNIVTDDRMPELVKRLCIDRTANAISLSTAVPSEQVGSRVSGKRGAIIGLAIDVVETRVSVWSLVLGIINALAVGALEHTKGARIANIAVDFPIASIAFDAWRTALSVEANRCSGTFFVCFAIFSVRLELGLVIGWVDAKSTTAKAHDLDKPCLVPSHSICRFVIHALVMAW
jgi:hypothetical protein